MIDTLKRYNDIFMQNYSRGDENSIEAFKYTDCNSNLILTAPHSTRSFCNKKEKTELIELDAWIAPSDIDKCALLCGNINIR